MTQYKGISSQLKTKNLRQVRTQKKRSQIQYLYLAYSSSSIQPQEYLYSVKTQKCSLVPEETLLL